MPVFTIHGTCNDTPQIKPFVLYIRAFRSTGSVPNTAVFCSSLMSCFPCMSLRYILNDLELVSPRTLQVAPHKASLFSSIVQASLCFTLYLWVKFGFGQWCTQEFFSGGVQQIQLRTEDRENGDLGAVAP